VRHGPSPLAAATGAAATGIVLDQMNGTLGESGNILVKGFNPTNPHRGDAIIATFFWQGSTNIITSVTDRLTDVNQTPVGNTYALVEYVTAGGISMATYVATNVQNFPDPNSGSGQVLAVQANLSASVTDGGVMLSAWSGVQSVSAQALGAHGSAAGAGSQPTVADPGAIALGAGALAYGITMSNAVVGHTPPAGFTNLGTGNDPAMKIDGEYAVQASAGSVDPRWTWFFNSPSTWLASVLALNPATAPPPPAPATKLAFTVQPSTTTAGSTISPPVRVTAQDNAGNTDASFTGSVTIALGTNPSGGTLSGTKTVAAVSGVATFSTLSIDKAGNAYTLQATAPALTGATSAAFNITAPPPPPGTGIALDQMNGTLGESGNILVKGFNPTNPHRGDAIIATFFWQGSTNIITSVTDRLTDVNQTPVGNTYALVEYVTAGGISMATYVATNVQNFPDPNSGSGQVLAVQANLSASVTDGGVMLSAWSGVQSVSAQALGAHGSAAGAGSQPTVADPGAIALGAGALAYGITMSNAVVGHTPPAGFTNLGTGNDPAMKIDGEYAVQASAGSVDPRWTWFFNSPSTWLASVLALNPATSQPPPVANFTSSCSGLTCNVDASSSTAQATATYNWNWGDGTPTGTGKTATHAYASGGTYSVTLTVTDAGGSSTKTQSVTVVPPPVANFTSSCSGLTCNVDASSSTAQATATYSWNWGDGTPAGTGKTATHAYAGGGTYSVTLTVTDAGGSSTKTQSVTVVPPPVANFTSGCSGLTCNVDASSSTAQATATYSWNWGDGTPAGTGKTAAHTYGSWGNYNVTLTVTDGGGSSTKTQTVTANQPPIVNAGPNETVLLGLLYTESATFSDPDNDGPWSYTIDWGDGSSTSGSTSSQGTITGTHTYLLTGQYTIRVTVVDSRGASGTSTKLLTVIL
jgi:PKD repeat protein